MENVQVKQTPEIIYTLPKAFSVNLNPNEVTSIKLCFNTDIDPDSLNGNIIVYDRDSKIIEGDITYSNRIAVYSFKESLKEGETYRILAKGDSEAYVKQLSEGNGIKSVLGIFMPKDFTYTISMIGSPLEKPEITYPSNYSLVQTNYPNFSWHSVEGAKKYLLEVSKFNTFQPLAIPQSSLNGIETSETNFVWSEPLEDGTYYVRVKALSDDLESEWSNVVQFNIDTIEKGNVSEGDKTEPVENTYKEVVDVYPMHFSSQVPLEIPGVAFRLLGDVNIEDINIKIVGRPIDSDNNFEYEEIETQMELIEDVDGTFVVKAKFIQEDEGVTDDGLSNEL
ncbi:MAG: Ig-like domain-containing protein [Ignavibacterium sp.]|nr:Ig-like domain-containing protein [Ignavibacterium sp.]